ncbi:hypothetical protein MMC13_008357 [Lambiella insularis]|nr:hypothetical protein [Lambiella insularis]
MDDFEHYKATLLEGFNRETRKFETVWKEVLAGRRTCAPNGSDALSPCAEALRQLEEKYKKLMDKHLKLVAKSREMKETLKSWELYHDKIKSRSRRKRQVQDEVDMSQTNNVPKATHVPHPSHTETSTNRPEPSQVTTQAPSSPAVTTEQLVRTSAAAVVNEIEQASEDPVLVSERSLKRKRVTVPSGSFSEPIVVKSEHGSSPLASANPKSQIFVNDTLDLEEVGVGKKQRLQNGLSSQSATLDDSEVFHRMPPSNVNVTGKIRSLDEAAVDDAGNPQHNNQAYFAELGRQYARKLWNLHEGSDPLLPDHRQVPDNARLARQTCGNRKLRDFQNLPDDHAFDKSEPPADFRPPMTPNVQPISRINRDGFLPKDPTTAKIQGGSSAYISLLSEGGENVQHESEWKDTSRAPLINKSPAPAEVHHRLQGLLSEPAPGNPILGEVTKGRLHPTSASPSTCIPTRKVKPDKKPLRALPVRSLHLEDFKINPAANHGVDFAFNEVCRTKHQRGGLPHCTKPECCGNKLYNAVKIGGTLPLQSRSPNNQSRTNEIEDDIQLLRDYLGFSAKEVLKMTEAEKIEALLTARARKFGQEYGKHRHAQERARSPPGFWRTEMPSTQEQEADKREAMVLEREEVDRRFAEATKTGGRWIFRDE